jgi:hypothetical protein
LRPSIVDGRGGVDYAQSVRAESKTRHQEMEEACVFIIKKLRLTYLPPDERKHYEAVIAFMAHVKHTIKAIELLVEVAEYCREDREDDDGYHEVPRERL